MSGAPVTGSPVRLAVVEDHDRYRQILLDVLGSVPGVMVVWACGDGARAVELLAGDPPDVVVVDLSLPGLSGLEVVAAITASGADTRCIVVSGHSERSYIERSREAGAWAYVLKGRPGELRDALAAVRIGEPYLSPRLVP